MNEKEIEKNKITERFKKWGTKPYKCNVCNKIIKNYCKYLHNKSKKHIKNIERNIKNREKENENENENSNYIIQISMDNNNLNIVIK